MRATIKAILRSVPGGDWLLQGYRSLRYPPRSVFTRYYHENTWHNEESVSGPGSTLEYTASLRRELPKVFEMLNVRTFLDAPCGDYHWMKEVQRGSIHYVGADIVEPLVARNRQKYGNANTSFTVLDIIKDPIPDADLWLCRDVIFHLSERDGLRVFANFLRSRVPYILTSTHPECTENRDILTGGFRLINLRLPPFNFPEPLLAIHDSIPGQPVRTQSLWSREDLSRTLPAKASRVRV